MEALLIARQSNQFKLGGFICPLPRACLSQPRTNPSPVPCASTRRHPTRCIEVNFLGLDFSAEDGVNERTGRINAVDPVTLISFFLSTASCRSSHRTPSQPWQAVRRWPSFVKTLLPTLFGCTSSTSGERSSRAVCGVCLCLCRAMVVHLVPSTTT